MVAVTSTNSKVPGRSGQSLVTETWYADPQNAREESRIGAEVISGYARSGDDFWLYGTIDGTFRVVHATSATELRFGGAIVQGSSLDEILAGYTPKGCSTAVTRGSATVAGRKAYVIDVAPRANICTNEKAAAKGLDEKAQSTITLWIDQETFLALRVDTASGVGTTVHSYEVTSFELGTPMDMGMFRYAPPQGTTLIEVASPEQAKGAFAGVPGSKQTAPGDGSAANAGASPAKKQ